MKQRLHLYLAALLALFTWSVGAEAQIELDDPVIEMGDDGPTYVKFVGTNATNNYRYTLDTYEGMKFQLTIDPIDASSPAAFTTSDLSDENYWEPLFRRVTAEMAGEQMEASRNIKKLYVNNVALVSNQFMGYCDAMKEVEITATGDYTIPSGCFAKGSVSGYSIKKLSCNIGGTLTLGSNVVDADAGGLSIYTYNASVAQVWYDYKQNNNAAFTVYLNDAVYEGGAVSDQLAITSVSATVTLNGSQGVYNIPDQGTTVTIDEYPSLTEFVFNGFSAKTTGEVTELFMDYAIVPEDYDWSVSPEWNQVYASDKGGGLWAVENADINVLQSLASNSTYKLVMSFNTNPVGKGDRAHFPTSSDMFSILFTTGDLYGGQTSNIVLDDPVIEMGDDGPTYVKFVGTNATNNYRYTLDTYEGMKFQLTIDPIDASSPAAFTTSDLSDENYWEPLFRRVTAEMAGEQMEASRNIKKIYVNNVALVSNQFKGYCDALKEVEITATGDYTIPSGCFAKGSVSGYSINKLSCNIGGTLTLGSNVVDADAGGLSIYTYNASVAQVWYNYKQNNNAAFTIYLNGENYEGSDDPNELKIKKVTVNLQINGNSQSFDVPNVGGSANLDDFGAITEFGFNNFKAETQGNVTELYMEYAIVPAGFDWSVRPDWKQVYASDIGSGFWAVENLDVDILQDLESNSSYVLAVGWHTNPEGKDGRRHYPTDGSTINVSFKTGKISSGLQEVATDEKQGSVKTYDLLGRRVKNAGKGTVVVRNRKKLIVR